MPESNTKVIKEKIVETYRRGVCDKDGKTLPKSKWGRSGKGSAFMGKAYYNQKYRDNYDLIVWDS
mgnify:FL=1